MVNIVDDKNTLAFLKDIRMDINKNGLNKQIISETLKWLIPKENNQLLVNYKIKEHYLVPACFVPNINHIIISTTKMQEWLRKNSETLKETYNIRDINTFKDYLAIFSLSHEVEHSFQYLIGEGIISSKAEIIKDSYKCLTDLHKDDDYIIPRPVKQIKTLLSLLMYNTYKNSLMMERDANIEGFELMEELAKYENNEEMEKLFNNFKNIITMQGYEKSTIGSIEQTYRKILMYGTYKRFNKKTNLTEEEKVRFGLNIKEETRQELIIRKRKKRL